MHNSVKVLNNGKLLSWIKYLKPYDGNLPFKQTTHFMKFEILKMNTNVIDIGIVLCLSTFSVMKQNNLLVSCYQNRFPVYTYWKVTAQALIFRIN